MGPDEPDGWRIPLRTDLNVYRDSKTIYVNSTVQSGNPFVASKLVNTKINLGGSVKQENVSDHSAKVIHEVALGANENELTISSAARNSEEQARVMFDKLEVEGVESMKALYGNNGDKVIDVYSEEKEGGSCHYCIKSEMVKKINSLGPSNVSKHAADPKKLQVFDIAPSSITNKDAFRRSIDSFVGNLISNRIHPGSSEKAYHIEIPQVNRK
jgi:hypothetical protein